ncbi:VENN motif pre-toxin domain-containing protein, partial [Gilliamella sp. B2838]|uniref:VENN motif pre-toxin domain-containing protein n=1 Tax=Gilliamella sp. B2838 TaxID=2818020 RepID=UPI00226A41DB
GGVGAAVSERGAEVIASILYPNKSIDELNQDEKQQVRALAQLATGLAIAALGGNAQDINTAIAGGKNAVENNYLSASEDKERKDAQAKLDLINKGSLVVSDEKKQELEGQVAILNALDAQRDEILKIACQNLSSSECNAVRIELQSAYASYFKTLSPEDYLAYNDAYANYTKYYDGYKKILSQLTELEGRDLAAYNEYKAQNLSDSLGISIESARNLVKFDNAMHSTAMLAAMIVGPNSIAGKGSAVAQADKVAAQAQKNLLDEINSFTSKSQANKNATMVGAYDPVTGKIAIGNSNANITAEALHPKTVKYIEQQLGVKIGEFTSFCKNKAGACAEVSAAAQLIRQGVAPERIKFTDAVRPRTVYEQGKITQDSIIKPCENCQITWPKDK